MKKTTFFLSLLFIVFAFTATQLSATEKTQPDWQAFSENLVNGLQSENEGIRQSAMQLVIEHGDKVDVNNAAFDVLHVFRNNDDQKVRQLALTTLTKMGNERVNYFLKRQVKFEADPVIRKQLEAFAAAK